jgi:hypothetical protein
MTEKPTTTTITTPTTTKTENYKIPLTNLYQKDLQGTSNIYAPYIYYHEEFTPSSYDMDNFTYLGTTFENI